MLRFLRIVGVIAWAAVLLLPAGFTVLHVTLVKPVDENRRKAPYPAAPAICAPRELHRWTTEFIRWFEDGFGGRDALIRLKNQIDFSIYRKSDRVHIGREGFLYYRNLLDVQVAEIERTPAATLDARVAALDRLGETLGRRGITLVVMPVPLKFTVYPEYLPRSAPVLPADRAFNRFRAALARQPHLKIFDAAPRMQELKSTLQVFNRTDFHWSEPAARRLGEALLGELQRTAGMAPIGSDWPGEFAPRPFSGGQAMFLPLFAPPREIALFPVKEPPYPTEGKDPPFDWAVRRTADRPLLPATVYIGDSFIWALHNTGFTTQFSEFYFSHVLKEDSKKLHRSLPPNTRFVVLQLLETNFLIDYGPQ